ncbi:acyl-CoA N-acyltransferase [Xylariomycetidae sp. FL2044]|nr:acyl-CoA N-acyltransferase [Xylariomycetidae sp. FL2044]
MTPTTTTTAIIIRPRTAHDLPACSAALAVVHKLNGYPVQGVDDAAAFLDTGDQAWVAVRAEEEEEEGGGGAVVGHIALEPAGDDVATTLWRELHADEKGSRVAILGRLFVHPDGRRGGTATRLIQTAVEEGRRRGLRLLILALVKDQDAIRLYRRLGWECYGTTVYRWGEGRQMDAECFASPVS